MEEVFDVNIKILYQDDVDEIVLFLTEDYTGQPMLCLNTFTKEDSSYKYDHGTGGHCQNLDLSNKYEIVNVTSVGNSSNSAVWGYLHNYPDAETVSYTLEDEKGNIIYSSEIEIAKENFIFEQLPVDIFERTHSHHYKVLDKESNTIIER
ncbi:hypothetical protein E3U55_15955 [Filobacillus milosensis]|uniref:Uncharacterized protein n=2 Tax=Filobacillus milosensis TaxID=94137 RepID=A0A4Y8IIN5_9BACI|nr:hypothetical protein E3U55_15955 [Filobacillus milosensis]